jgi:hypothetical protein
MYASYVQAFRQLPLDAQWSSSFGNPGEGGYQEYHRTPSGDRYIISNGPHYLHSSQFDWHCQKLEI